MTSASAPPFPRDREDPGVLLKCALAAFVLEAGVLTLAGWHSHWLAHPPKQGEDTSKFIEAEVFQAPPEAHLIDEKKPVAAPPKHEAVLSKAPDRGREAKPSENKLQEENQTQGGPPLAPTHGPVAVFSPAPLIPAHLRYKDLHTSVVIDFFVSSQGVTTPRLVGSSGDEELDAIAVAAAKRWQFRPGEKEHHPIDSKVRLRIVFDVQ